jgi:hypothetical protein
MNRVWTRSRSGFPAVEERLNVQCEVCHGPGGEHIVDAKKYPVRDLRTPREWREQVCGKCHDLDNSIPFNAPGGFEKYFPKVDHRDVPKEDRYVKDPPPGGGTPGGEPSPAGMGDDGKKPDPPKDGSGDPPK